MGRGARRLGWCAAFLVAVLAMGGAAEAQTVCGATEQARADDFEERGRRARSEERNEEALRLFRQAYELCRGARALARMGLAEEVLERWVEAAAHLEAALAARGDAWIEENRALLERELRLVRAHLGTLSVVVHGPPAEVFIGDRSVGRSPLNRPLRVAAGTVVVTARAQGQAPVTRQVDVPAGETARIEIELARETGAGDSGATWRTLGVVAAAGAAVGLAVGVVGSVLREQEFDDHNALLGSTECRPVLEMTATQALYDRCTSLYEPARRRFLTDQALQVGGLVTAGVLAGAAVILFVVAPSRARPGIVGVRLACGGGPGDFGIDCALRF